MASEEPISLWRQVAQFTFTAFIIGLIFITYRLYSYEYAGILDESQKAAFLGISSALGLLLSFNFFVGHILYLFDNTLRPLTDYFCNTCGCSTTTAGATVWTI